MSRSSSSTLLLVLLLGGALCGCTSHSRDAPDPFPTRPFPLEVTSVDPCAALTDLDIAEFDLRYGSSGISQGGTSRGCTWPGEDGIGVNLQTFDDRDATVAIGADPTSTVVTVAGFGAVQSSPPARGTGLPFCQVVLDVADDASLRAQLQVSPLAEDADRRTVEGTCEQVRTVAAQMLENLRVQQGQ